MITRTKHFPHIPMALQELPIGLPAAIIADMRLIPFFTSMFVSSKNVIFVIFIPKKDSN
jgi:hypothetical protein